MQKPSASFLSSQDPLMFLSDSGTCTNLGDSLNLFSSTGYDECIKHLLCSLHWLAVNVKTNPRLAPLSWSHLVSWCQCPGVAPGWQWSPGWAQCPVPCSLGQEGSFLLRRAERSNHPSQTPGPSSALLSGEVLPAAATWFSSLLCSHPGGIPCSGIPSWESLPCGWWPGPFPSLEKFSCCLCITSWKYHGNYLLFCQTSVWWKRPWEVYLPQEQYFQMTCRKKQTCFELNVISSLCLCSFCSGNV